IFGSTDGKKWLPLSEEINFQEQTWNNINATKNVKVRYLKLEFNVQDYLGSLSEIKIFK
ncbi:MAG: carbohydrate-binding protein, partial [Prevotella salivae]|nr:carbohydrate-binding protein [Segatella salivae]